MSRGHKVFDQFKPHYITMTVNSWLKIFLDPVIAGIVIDSLKYCQARNGLEIYAYCIMPDHIHMVCRSTREETLSSIVRDFKKFTSSQILKYLDQLQNKWSNEIISIISMRSSGAGGKIKRVIWKKGFCPIELSSNNFIDQKIDYIHFNPVKAGIVVKPEKYRYSSAISYAGGIGELEIIVDNPVWRTYR